MAEKLDINVTHGVGYIKEFNGVINFGSNEKFVPMIEWLKNEIPIKVKSIGKRYAPNLSNCDELNINLSISESFDYFDSRFTYSKILLEIKNIIARKAFVKNDYGSFDKTTAHNINIENIQNILDLKKIIEKLINLLTTDYEHAESMKKAWGDGISPADIHDYDMDISNMINKINLLEKLVVALEKESMYRLHIKSILLISGEALIGKTHLLCDTALNRLKLNQPTLLFFGHEFSADKSIILNIIHRLKINNCSETEFLEALNKLGMEYNTRTLIVIDAINETENPKIWQKEIIEFCEKIKSYSNLALVLSIRDVEKNKFITNDNEQYIENEIVEIQHRGFEGIEIDAVKTFCNALGVEFPKVPLHTNRLFINPGILFLYIEIIKETTKKIDTSIINPTIIFKAYIDKLNRDFSQKYHIDEDDRIIEEAIRLFISVGTKKYYTHFYIPQKVVSNDIKLVHEKVLDFLKSEGVLNKLKNNNEVNLYFTYQKFENFFIAEYLLNDFEKNKSVIFDLIKGYNGAMTEALFMQIPEKLGKEIFDLNVWIIRDSYICKQYITSLIWKKPELINDDTFKYLNLLLPKHDLYENYLDTVLQLSTIPNHPLNIKRLHKRLLEFSLVERDYNWSIYIHNSYSNGGIINRIINWAWSKNIDFEINDDSLYLYGLTLGWFLTSSNRELRDATTKALVTIFTDNISCFLDVLKEFNNVNDLYITERLYAVAYGITLRSNNQKGYKELAEYIYNSIFNVDSVIEHIMIRDYAKLTVEYIYSLIKLDIHINKVKPPYRSILPDILPTDEEIDSHEKNSGKVYDILRSMITESGRSGNYSYGDFGRYTFQSNLKNFKLENLRIQDLSNYAVKIIIEEMIDNKELFSQAESNLRNVSYSRNEHKVERIGKKYQWIAFYKILALVADNYKIIDRTSFDNVTEEYKGTFQLSCRNIDPTTILRNQIESKYQCWLDINQNFECLELTDKKWMNTNKNLPKISDIVNISFENKNYLLMDTSFTIDGNKEKDKYRNLYYCINSFILKKENLETFISWANNQVFYARKMPESSSFYRVFLREYPFGEAYDSINNYYNSQMSWETTFDDEEDTLPCEVLLTSTSYMNEASGYDNSVENIININLPNKWIIEKMNLKQSLNDGEWIDKNENIIFFDKGTNNEKKVLLADKEKLLEFLDNNEYTICWIMWGEKQVRDSQGGFNEKEFLGISELNSFSYLKNNNIVDSEIQVDFKI